MGGGGRGKGRGGGGYRMYVMPAQAQGRSLFPCFFFPLSCLISPREVCHFFPPNLYFFPPNCCVSVSVFFFFRCRAVFSGNCCLRFLFLVLSPSHYFENHHYHLSIICYFSLFPISVFDIFFFFLRITITIYPII